MVESQQRHVYIKSKDKGCASIQYNKSDPPIMFKKDSKKVLDLTNQEMQIACKARLLAIMYLQDLITYFFEGFSDEEIRSDVGQFLEASLKPKNFQLNQEMLFSSRGDVFNLTRSSVEKIKDTLTKIQFKKIEGSRDFEDAYAYVKPDDNSDSPTVYLCPKFWKADTKLIVNSQPGTLIHEVSHFKSCLGLDDVFLHRIQDFNRIDSTYSENILKRINSELERTQGPNFTEFITLEQLAKFNEIIDSVDYKEIKVGGYTSVEDLNTYLQRDKLTEKETTAFYILMWYMYFNNANNLEYELEIRFNHDGQFGQDGKWTCCGHNVKHSICRAEYVVKASKTTAQNDRTETLNLKTKMLAFLYPPGVQKSKFIQMTQQEGQPNPEHLAQKIHYKLRQHCETSPPLKADQGATIGILGGGIAGLYTALIIKYLQERRGFTNLKFHILEKTDRVGGRLLTENYDKTQEWQYSDMGAMRLPALHAPVYDMIDYINEKIREKNQGLPQDQRHQELEVIPYFYSSVDADKAKDIDVQKNPDAQREIHFVRFKQGGFSFLKSDLEKVYDESKGTPSQVYKEDQKHYMKRLFQISKLIEDDILSHVSQKMMQLLKQATQKNQSEEQFEILQKKMKEFYQNYGGHSVSSYLFDQIGKEKNKKNLQYSRDPNKLHISDLTMEDIVEYESVFAGSNELQYNLVDWLLDASSVETRTVGTSIWGRGPLNADLGPPNRYFNTLKGGLQTITDAIFWLLGDECVSFNSSVLKVEGVDGNVRVTYQNSQDRTNKQVILFDKVVVAIPSPACANIEWEGSCFPETYNTAMKAFRLLNYFPLFKLSLQFKERFWENKDLFKPGYTVVGGQAYTELSSRWFVFPSYGFEEGYQTPGTILIYNWAGDAVRWNGMSEDDQVYQAIQDMNTYFNSIRADGVPEFDIYNKYYTGNHYSQKWSNTPATGTSFFGPYQFEIVKQIGGGLEGKIYFATEYMSVHHAWILGSIESACYAMRNIVGPKEFNRFLIPWEYDESNSGKKEDKSLGFENFKRRKQ